jgi:uncharacterized protein YndB with AHSA1/START domain
MTTERRATVHVKRRFEALPARVFDAWIDPRKVRCWIGAPAAGEEVARLALKPRVGQTFSFVVHRGHDEILHSGEYIEIVRAQRLVFTLVVPNVSKETTLVSIDLSPVPGVARWTDLALRHERVLPAALSRTEARWNGVLDEIATIVHS